VPVLINLLEALQAVGLEPTCWRIASGAHHDAAVGAACSKPTPVVGEMIPEAADVSAEPDNDDFGQMLKRHPCTRRITIYARITTWR
jgi:hypothetical protein